MLRPALPAVPSARRRTVLVAVLLSGLPVLPVLVPAGPAAALSAPVEVLALDRDQVVLVSTPPGAPPTRVATGQTPAVAPDGSRVAFTEFTTAGGVRSLDLFTARPDGTERRQVTTGRDDDAWPAFSPDGRTLAFLRDVPLGRRHLAVVPVDGGPVRLLAPAAGPPTWSPDGALLAYGDGGLAVVGADGRNPGALLTAAQDRGYGDPAWSPDGRRLLVATSGATTSSIETVEVAGGATRTVVTSADPQARVSSPAWAPDGRTAYLQRGHAPGRVERVDADSGAPDPSFGLTGSGPSIGGGEPQRRTDAAAPGSVTGLTAAPAPSRVELRYALPPEADRAGVLVRYAVGTVPPASPDDGLDGGRALLDRAVVPRLLAGTTYAFAVFARDWSGNHAPAATVLATTPREVATTFRVAADRPLVVRGQTVGLGARLVREDTGAPVEGAVVRVLARTAGGSDQAVATVRTDAAGLARTLRRPSATTRYTLRYDGDGQLQPGTGSPLVEVQAAVGVAVRPGEVARGGRAVVEAAVRPAQRGALVTVTVVSQAGRVLDTHRVRQDAAGRVVTGVSTAVRGRHDVFVSVRDSPAARGTLVRRSLVVRQL